MLAKRMGAAAIALVAFSGVLCAQAPGDDTRSELQAMKARLEALEQQNRELQERLKSGVPIAVEAAPGAAAAPENKAVEKIVDDYMKKKEEAKAKAAAEKARTDNEGYKVGTILDGATVQWDPNIGGWLFATKNKDFTFHPEARIQMDDVWWTQNAFTKPLTQLGDYEDGTFFRRTRIHFDGTMWEVVEFNFEFALENIQANILTDDEQFIGLTSIPLIGTIRAGHMRAPHGFEGDNMSSSKAMQFLERSSMSQAIFEDFNFAPGIFFTNHFCNDRMTYELMGYRTEQNDLTSAADFGDGEYAVTGRVTALPVYRNDGRCLVHLGYS